MLKHKNKWFLITALAVVITVIAGAALVMGDSDSSTSYTVMATNDIGMHCACPTFSSFLLLPPYNTIRVQVIKKGGDSASIVSSGITVNYALKEETDASLQADPYYSQWIAFAPKIFKGFVPVVSGKVKGLTGNGITGTAKYDSNSKSWIATGIPAYPVHTGTSNDIMIDPLGGPARDPYLTANITVKNSSGTTIGTTSTVVPVAFGGCCGCHIKAAAANGYPATAAGGSAFLGKRHSQNTSKIDFNYIDPDGDGVGGPIRCSWCHWDPAMGESKAPGIVAVWPNYKILAGATFTSANVKVSTRSFSDVLHKFHAQSAVVTSSAYDPNVAKNCYDCHPGNGVNCYRGVHKGKSSLWCTDCHGNLNQRISAGQLSQPWQQSTLPSCYAASKGATPSASCHATVPQTTWSGLFGKYINARGGMGGFTLCTSCHGSPHAEWPSTLALDNVQPTAIQKSASFPSGKNATYAIGACSICHTDESDKWSSKVMYGEED